MKFGEFVKERRTQLRIPLREFCRCNGLDPAYISKLERGVISPPKSKKVLKKLALALEIKPETAEWYELFDLAAVEKGVLPPDILKNKKLCEKLPIVFRTLRGDALSEEKLDELVNIIRNVRGNSSSGMLNIV